jgi:hypothetical protein
VGETAALSEPDSAETADSSVSRDARSGGQNASGEPGLWGGAGNQTPLACTPWAWLAHKQRTKRTHNVQSE